MASPGTTGLGSPAAGSAGLPPTQGFSLLSPSSWFSWSSVPVQPNPTMQDLQAATRQLTQALQNAAEVAGGSNTEGANQLAGAASTLAENLLDMHLEDGAKSAEGVFELQQRIGAGSSRSGSAFSFQSISDDAEHLLQQAQESIKVLSDQNMQLRLELQQLQTQQTATQLQTAAQFQAAEVSHASALTGDQYTNIIRRLNQKLTDNKQANEDLQKKVEELQRLKGSVQQAGSMLGSRIDHFFQVFRQYYNEKSPAARGGIIAAMTLIVSTVLYGIVKIVNFATTAISEMIWGPYDPSALGPDRKIIPLGGSCSVPIVIDENGNQKLDEYGKPVIDYAQALSEQDLSPEEQERQSQFKALQEQHPDAPRFDDGMIDLNYTDPEQPKDESTKDEL